jgi:hypothetical protein
MSITLSPAKAGYLARVTQGLSDLPAEEREEMVQDLEAHLSELEDEEVERVLGSPEAFVEEFRVSAGLGQPTQARPSRRARAREDLNLLAARLSAVTHWQTVRPLWVWTRGWLLVCAWSLLYDYEGFERFPIPSIAQSSAYGLVLVVAATALSVWLAKGTAPGARAFGSVVLSAVSGLALIGLLLNPMPTYSEVAQQYEGQFYIEQLTDGNGNPINNVYAYDLEGNPMEVLLFDQDGRPLLTLPPYVYEDAEIPGNDPASWGQGTVAFHRDRFGRIITNLYPLDMTVYAYDEYGSGEPVPMTPPSLGIPDVDEPPVDQPNVPTTLGYLR